MQPGPEAGVATRLTQVGEVVDATLVDLAMLLAGRHVDLEYFEAGLARRVREAIAPFLEGGWRLDPDFGDRASADVEGVEEPGPVDVTITLMDRSVVVEPGGARRGAAEAWWRLTLRVDPEGGRLIALAVGRP
jgi:hypothetical protein